jgi:energy-coupling factor transporter transmembrane protein EcfT
LGAFLFLFAIVILIVAAIMHKFTWFLLIPLGISFLLLFIGNKVKYDKYEIGEYHTIRDLIIGMKRNIKNENIKIS